MSEPTQAHIETAQRIANSTAYSIYVGDRGALAVAIAAALAIEAEKERRRHHTPDADGVMERP